METGKSRETGFVGLWRLDDRIRLINRRTNAASVTAKAALHSSFNGERFKSHHYRRRRTCYLLISASIPAQLAEWRKIRNSTLASRELITQRPRFPLASRYSAGPVIPRHTAKAIKPTWKLAWRNILVRIAISKKRRSISSRRLASVSHLSLSPVSLSLCLSFSLVSVLSTLYSAARSLLA